MDTCTICVRVEIQALRLPILLYKILNQNTYTMKKLFVSALMLTGLMAAAQEQPAQTQQNSQTTQTTTTKKEEVKPQQQQPQSQQQQQTT